MRQTFLIRLGIVVNAALALTLLLSWAGSARRGEFWRADFSMFYTAFAMVRDGNGAALYDLEVQLAYQRDVVPERGPDGGLLPFNYPPHAAVPGFVISYLPRDAAFYAWSLLQVGLLAVLMRQLLSWTSSWPAESRVLLGVTVVGFPALFASFQMGQVSLLILVSLTGMTRALERQRPFLAAAWFVLATIKPQLALVPAVVLVADRRWRVLAFTAALFLAWAGLATLMLGPTVWLDWFHVLRHSATQAGELGIFPERMYNFKGLLYGILGADHFELTNRASLFALMAGFLLPLVMWWIDRPDSPQAWRMRVALCLQFGLLTNPHFNPADAVVFVLPAMLYLLAETQDRWISAKVAFLVVCPLLFYIDCYRVERWPLGVRPFFVAMVVLAAVMALRPRGSLAAVGAERPHTPDRY